MTTGIDVTIVATTAAMIDVTITVARTATTGVTIARLTAAMTSAVTVKTIGATTDVVRTTTTTTAVTTTARSDLHRHHLKGATPMGNGAFQSANREINFIVGGRQVSGTAIKVP
jgi:hypothetical protein